MDPRDRPRQDKSQTAPSPALWSEALCAAGKCVAGALNGIAPAGVRIGFSQRGRWTHEIDGPDISISSTVGREIALAGTAARHLSDFDEPDAVAVLENAALIATSKIKTQDDYLRFVKLNMAAMDLVIKHQAVVKSIAGRLVVNLAMTGEELAAHLAPVIAPARRRA